jgi:GAF domain-containing protein
MTIAFDQLARIVLADNSMQSVLTTVAQLSQQAVPGADAVSITFVERGTPSTVAMTAELALTLDERQYDAGAGPCLAGIETGSVVEIEDMRQDRRWPEFATAAVEHGAGSSLSVPIPLQRDVGAALNIYSTRPQAFDGESRRVAGALADYAGVAIANMHVLETQGRVAEQLKTAMQSRAVIEQAKGVLMGQHRCSADEAFGMLVARSQRSNRKLRDVAQALVDEVAASPPADPTS